jgi:hypothetical protein
MIGLLLLGANWRDLRAKARTRARVAAAQQAAPTASARTEPEVTLV